MEKNILKCLGLSYAMVIASFYAPHLYNSIAIIICSFVSLIALILFKIPLIKLSDLPSFLLFLILIFGLSYTENIKIGTQIVETHLSLILLPIVIKSSKLLTSKQVSFLLNFYIACTLGFGLLLISNACYDYFTTGTEWLNNQSGHIAYNRFYHQNLTSPFKFHAVFYSFYVTLAGILIYYKLLSQKKSLYKKFLFLIILISFYGMLFLLKSAMFLALFPLSILILSFLKFKSKLKLLSVKISFAVVCLFVGYVSFNQIENKIGSLSSKFSYSDEFMNPLSIRLFIWESSWNVIQQNKLLGVGTGDANAELVKEYNHLGFNIGARDKFNSHNMYLQYWISNGIFALVAFFSILLTFIYQAVKKNNVLLLLFTFLFVSFSLTESTMLKQSGIVFFLFFSYFFTNHTKPGYFQPTK